MKHHNSWIGICGLREVEWDKDEGEFGIIVDPKYWRMGYSVEAHIAIIEYAFEKLKLQKIKFITDAEERNPMRLFYAKFGIKFVKILENFMMVQARDKKTGEIKPDGGEEY